MMKPVLASLTVAFGLAVSCAQAQPMTQGQALEKLARDLDGLLQNAIPDLMRASVLKLEESCRTSSFTEACFRGEIKRQLRAKYPAPCTIDPVASDIASIYMQFRGADASNAELTQGWNDVMREEYRLSRCDRAPQIRP